MGVNRAGKSREGPGDEGGRAKEENERKRKRKREVVGWESG